MNPDLCPHCGAEVPEKARVCPECGADAETGDGVPPVPAPGGPADTYPPPGGPADTYPPPGGPADA